MTRLLGRCGQAEALEPRQMLSADLPQGAEWIDWGAAQVSHATGSYVVTFNDYMGRDNAQLFAQDVAAQLGTTVVSARGIGAGLFAEITFARDISFAEAAGLQGRIPTIKSIEPNAFYEVDRVPNDPQYAAQWSLDNAGQVIRGVAGTPGADIGAEAAWDVTIGNHSTVVGIIDTGVDMQHPDLINNIWTNPNEIAGNGIDDDGNGYVDDIHGFDFGQLDNDPDDDVVGHGTHVAGTIAAVGNNGIGVTGIAWNASILPLKIADQFGRLSTAAIVGAHDYARNLILHGVNLAATNNSYGLIAGNFYEDQPTGFNAERDAIQRYVDAGGIFVAAAGNNALDNDNPNARSYPASYNIPGVIAVAATDSNDGLANFSNYGVATVDIAAPGVNILSTYPTDLGDPYELLSGTSMASPTVAGVVALIRSVKPTASAVEVRELLINSSDLLPSLQGKVRSGGRVNAARALQMLNVEGPVVRTFEPGPVTTQINSVTNTPLNKLSVTFSEALDPTAPGFGSSAVTVRGDGADNIFNTSDDLIVPVTSLALDSSSSAKANIQLNLSGGSFPGGRLPVDAYRVTLVAGAFRDVDGNRLNGTVAGGVNENLDFRVVALSGDNEPNDAMSTATPVAFDASGTANFGGATVGNGSFGNRDVDLYQVTLTRGGQITAEITAQRLVAGSSLDSYLRLFDASGNQLAFNDQAFGNDSYLDYYVSTGGTYYIGVSGFGNAGYNPQVAGSGASQSTGNYSLRITAALNQDDVVTYTAASNSLPGQPALPLNIPRGGEPNPPDATQGTTTAGIVVADTRQVLDINLKLNLQHTSISDLQISLIAPDNREVQLFNRRGGTGDDMGTRNSSGSPLTYTIFDDEASTAVTAASAPYSGSFRPENALGLFDGLAGAGTWTLRIVDAQAGDSGRLVDWQLVFTFQNNVFGPYESNDTINTANRITEFTGTGSATRDAFLGDGGFGSLDRDIYRFNASAGSALTAIVTPTGVLDSALRLFDAAGTQIIVSNPSGTQSSSINGYVFANGGTYYLAVSEAGNVTYDPNAVATGVAAATTGGYSLSVSVAPGVTDPAGALVGSGVTIGYNVDGLYNGTSGGNAARLKYQGLEMISSTTRSMFIGASAGPVAFVNESPNATTQLPFSVINQSDQFNLRAMAKASLNGLTVERTMSFGVDDSFVAIDVRLTNTTSSLLSGVYWMEGFNPDPGIALNENNRATVNDVDSSGKIASASYTHNQFLNGLRVALVAPESDTRARATVVPAATAVRDAEQFAQLPSVDPNGGIATDSKLALSYSLGDLVAGGSVSMRYFIFLATSQAELDARVTALNTGTAGGHLAVDPSDVALDTLSNGDTVPQYPYRYYYPEGFNGANIFNFMPMSNPNVEDAHVVVIQHFEGVSANLRDRVVDRVTIEGLRRRGVDVNLPQYFANQQFPPNNSNPSPAAMPAEVQNKPYALEIRSDRPIAATFSYYDLTQIASGPVAVGESFTPEVSSTWTFAAVDKNGNDTDAGDDINSYIVFFNPTKPNESDPNASNAKATIRAFNTTTGQRFRLVRDIAGWSRSGAFMSDFWWDDESTTVEEALFLPNGQYGVVVTSTLPIVASKTTFNPGAREATGTVGNVGLGATKGLVSEGEFGLRNADETIGVLNANSGAAQVTFSFIYSNGSTYRTVLDVPANSHRSINVADLPNFISGQAYSVYYEASQPVSISSTVPLVEGTFSDALSVSSATRAYSYWGFGEGFRPGDSVDWNSSLPGIQQHPGLTENLRLYNPTSSDIIVEITMNFDDQPGTETFRRTIPARRMQEFNVDQFVTGDRRSTNQSYGIFVKAPVPIVAEMNHYDRLFPGAFATLGVPLGVTSSIT